MLGRPASIIPTVSLRLKLPEPLRAKIDILLFSVAEQRVPMGAYQRFFVALLEEYFDKLEKLESTNVNGEFNE